MRLQADALLPHDDSAPALSCLRARFETMIANGPADVVADWTTLQVSGPVPMVDGRGNTWFRWAARVESGRASVPETTGALLRAGQPGCLADDLAVPPSGCSPEATPRLTVNDLGLLGRQGATIASEVCGGGPDQQ
jgi:hypothetical protein